MKKGPLRLLLDTNILLDEYIPTRPSSVASRQLIGLALEQGHSLLYVGRAIVDVHYVISHTFKQMVREERGTVSKADALAIAEIAWGCVDNLSEMATAVGMDNGDVWLARKYRALHGDFEDNFVLAAAERAGGSGPDRAPADCKRHPDHALRSALLQLPRGNGGRDAACNGEGHGTALGKGSLHQPRAGKGHGGSPHHGGILAP